MQKGSIQSLVSQMAVGDYRYIETTPEAYATVQRSWNVPPTRRHESIKNFVLTCTLYQAVRVGELGRAQVLVKVERIA